MKEPLGYYTREPASWWADYCQHGWSGGLVSNNDDEKIVVSHTGADLLHEAFFKFTSVIRSEISLMNKLNM